MQLDFEKLRETRKIYIGTPMYGSMANGSYVDSMLRLAVLCEKAGIPFLWDFLQNESLIPRARNYTVANFLKTDYTHFMFIDADIQFNPIDVIAMSQLCDEENENDIVVGAYPKKNISWEKIKRAVDAGLADKDPNDLARYMGDFVIGAATDGEYRGDELIPLREAGTGFMMIKRSVFEKMAKAYPEYSYTPDHKRTADFNGSQKITAFFQDPIVDDRYLSEDYFFCHQARKIGLNVMLCPWIKLNHIGAIPFTGDLLAVVGAGLSATIDPKDVKNGK